MVGDVMNQDTCHSLLRNLKSRNAQEIVNPCGQAVSGGVEEDTGSQRPGRRGGQALQTGLESGCGHFALTGPKRGI